MYKINKNNKKTIEEMIEELYKDKTEDLKIYGNYNLYKIYNKNENLIEKFKNSIVRNFI